MSKAKGISAERELVHMFWKQGFAAIRVAGSGSSKYPCPDVLAGNNVRKLAIECKSTKSNNQYFTQKEIDELKEFSDLFGTECWVAVRFDRMSWFFVSPEDLKETREAYVVSKKTASDKGLLFEELIK